ncbi:MAG: chemotaxis protein CheR, partial [Gammaproteobacteria bacterium]|nr:chemotaxis protein CheR [Gammaproteobacteria bacterium]
MHDDACVQFLQWALPQLHMRWPGFRKVRAQVCKRLQRRLYDLHLTDVEAYRDYIEQHVDEWDVLDSLVRVTISRFYRDKMMFAFLGQQVLPDLATQAIESGDKSLNILSVGCASGEEPYTLAIIWQLQLQQRFPDLNLHIVAIDAD